MRVVVIGLDGATFDVLNKLIQNGRMKYIASLLRNGVSSNLVSTVPPDSAPAWPTIVTGVNAGKHGIFDFLKKEGYTVVPVTPNYPKGLALWDLLSNAGKTVGFINVPLTFPPKPTRGFMITGFPTPKDTIYTFPSELQAELARQFGENFLGPAVEGENKDIISNALLEADTVTKATLYLIGKYSPDFLMVVFTGIDRVQHYFWKYINLNAPESLTDASCQERIYQYFEKIDEYIRTIYSKTPSGTNLIIISDHGFGSLRKYINVNNWLAEKGYLKFKNDLLTKIKMWLYKIGINPKNMYFMIEKIHLRGAIKGAKTNQLLSGLSELLFLSHSRNIDWQNTKAFCTGIIGWGLIFLNVKGINPMGIIEPGADYHAVREDIIRELSSFIDSETNEKIVDRVFRKEDIYDGPYIGVAPDIVFKPKDGYFCFFAHNFMSAKIIEPSFGLDGHHRQSGVMIAYGPDFAKGKTTAASVFDITPTVLHMFEIPIPTYIDGKVLRIFDTGSPLAVKEPITIEYTFASDEKYVLTKQEIMEIEARLKNLGYLG